MRHTTGGGTRAGAALPHRAGVPDPRAATTPASRAGAASTRTPARRGASTALVHQPQPSLDAQQRAVVLGALQSVLGGAYAHLPAKRAAYAVDPVHALELLGRRAGELSDVDFHLALTSIVTGLRDAHTRYVGPSSRQGWVASLPFLVEQYGRYEDARFLVTKATAWVQARHPDLLGARIAHWNAVPMARAVDLYADQETGGRPDSRRARALESLTFRALDYAAAPAEDWVVLDYRGAHGAKARATFRWQVVAPGTALSAVDPHGPGARRLAVDPAAEAVRRAKKRLFAHELWKDDDHAPERASRRVSAGSDWLATPLQDVLAARPLRVGRRTVGYLRMWSFDVDDDQAYVVELQRLLGLLPQDGLVVDLRANPGGLIWAAERALQLFGSGPIAPTRFSLLASPLTRSMADSPVNAAELGAWSASLGAAVSTGELYAQPLPLTDPAACNDVGRVYPGRCVAVVDPNTYSSGDLFAAGWVDNAIGPLVSVGHASGAGGANVWTYDALRESLRGTAYELPGLPAGTNLSVAIRRAIRAGASEGVPIEDLGVPGIPYDVTRRDLLASNRDLMAFCARLL